MSVGIGPPFTKTTANPSSHSLSVGGALLPEAQVSTAQGFLRQKGFARKHCALGSWWITVLITVFLNIILFIYFWLCWVFLARAVSRGYSSCGAWASHCSGFSCCAARTLGSRASAAVAPRLQSTGSAVAVQGLSCSVACGILPVQGSITCLLHWQADSLPLSHQGSP